jgi:hypothetical protein
MSKSHNINRILQIVFGSREPGIHHMNVACHRTLTLDQSQEICDDLEKLLDESDLNPAAAEIFRNRKLLYKTKFSSLFCSA